MRSHGSGESCGDEPCHDAWCNGKSSNDDLGSQARVSKMRRKSRMRLTIAQSLVWVNPTLT